VDQLITRVAVAQPPFFKNKIVNYKKTTSFIPKFREI